MPTPQQPWQPQWQPTAPYPPVRPKKKSTLTVVLWSVLGAVILCFGGLATLGAILEQTEKPAVQETAGRADTQPLGVTGSSSPAAPAATAGSKPAATRAAVEPTSPAPTVTKKPKPSPTKTRATPKPKPTTTKPSPKPKPTTTAPKKTVTPGAFCTPEGATGVSKKGKLYRCTRKAGEERARWRAV